MVFGGVFGVVLGVYFITMGLVIGPINGGVQHMGDLFLGIDPGIGGAVSLLTGRGEFVSAIKFDGGDPCQILAGVFKAVPDIGGVRVYMEAVHSAPGQGVVSMFTFGVGYGRIQGWLFAMGIDFTLASPQAWQRWLPCYDKDPKTRVRMGVKERWGVESFILPGCRVPHKGAMDAAAIAEYGRLVALGEIEEPTPRAPRKRRREIKIAN